jgi:ribosomal protein S18 acetylase RimI-like enzyme
MEYDMRKISASDIHIVKEIWEELNSMHYEKSDSFKQHYAGQTFERRCEKFTLMPEEDVLIEAAFAGEKPVAYCICSIDRGRGEIDSIYIKPCCRRQSLGSVLARRGMDWMKSRGCSEIAFASPTVTTTHSPSMKAWGFAKDSPYSSFYSDKRIFFAIAITHYL